MFLQFRFPHSVTPSLIYREVEIFEKKKNIEGGGSQKFLVKMGVGYPYRAGVVYKRGIHCFPLMMYGFCSKNVFYSASFSFIYSI